MRISTLLARNLGWYWRTNLAVLLGVATAAAVLGGALLVGDSVRASLRSLALSRLGNTRYEVSRNGFFREQLAQSYPAATPVIAINGMVSQPENGRRAFEVEVYGLPGARDVRLSAALAAELDARSGHPLLIRVEKPSAIPLESLHGRKEDAGKTMRVTCAGQVRQEISLSARQGDVRAVYLPLSRLQRELGEQGKINTILVAGAQPPARPPLALEDLGIHIRNSAVETDSALLSDYLAEKVTAAAQALGVHAQPVLTYLANTIQDGSREIPYSVVTALETSPAPADLDGITLNQWAAHDLNAKPGDQVTLAYYVWKSDGRLHTESARFHVSQIVPVVDDHSYAPDYPGITQSSSLRDWDPPFPLDLKRVRPQDEAYWKQYRTTPKAFIALARGQQLWATRFGRLTSIRLFPLPDAFAPRLLQSLDPAQMGFAVAPVRERALAAARGSTDFGEYFVYFSFFLMISALLLTGLFFKLGIEQRMHEIGILRALGFSMAGIRGVFLREAAVLACAGALLGVAGALAYGELMVYGLRTWWVDAVGTRLISLHPSAVSLACGAATGMLTGMAAAAWTLRRLAPVTPRGLLEGAGKPSAAKRSWMAAAVSGILAAALLTASLAGAIGRTPGFFGAGSLFLIAALAAASALLHSRAQSFTHSLWSLGLRGAAYRPGRSLLVIAQIACATFLIVAVDAFHRDLPQGVPGYPLMAESVLPLIYDPNTADGRAQMNIPQLDVRFVSFRLRPGDDASCLNLYQPRNPRILGVPAAYRPGAAWKLLDTPLAGGAIPALADANSITYVLHLKVGAELTVAGTRYRIVGALEDSIFQSELLISESNFLRLFPDIEGYRFFLLHVPPQNASQVTIALQDALADYGFAVRSTAAVLAGYHRVENTYLSTFRSLGGLGLVLGTVGLAAILLRNLLERRREMALLRAVGYRRAHLAAMVLAENLLLLAAGLATGTVCALLAIAPAAVARGGHLPLLSLAVLLGAVMITGVGASLAAARAVWSAPLLAALGAE